MDGPSDDHPAEILWSSLFAANGRLATVLNVLTEAHAEDANDYYSILSRAAALEYSEVKFIVSPFFTYLELTPAVAIAGGM